MLEPCRTLVVGEDDDASQLLAAIGIPSDDVLKQAARDGEFSRDNCHEYHPPSFAGSASWADTLRSLAVAMKPLDWRREERNGLSVLVSPSGKYAIAVQLGDKATGIPHMMPATRYPKGIGTLDVVRTNRDLILPGMEEHLRLPKVRPLPANGCQTWFFMRRRPYVMGTSMSDPSREVRWYADHVFLELSLPIMSEVVFADSKNADDDEDYEEPRAQAKVKEWAARIIIGKTPLAPESRPEASPGPTSPDLTGTDDSSDGMFHIQITRKK